MLIDIRHVQVYYITTTDSKEKASSIEKKLTDYGFSRFKGITFTRVNRPKLGCALSHNTILATMAELNNFPVIILEDDVQIDNLVARGENDFLIEIPDDADAVYLGISQWGLYRQPKNGHALSSTRKVSAEKYDGKLHRIYNMLSAHAILYLNKEYVSFLHRATKFSISINDNQDKARAQSMKFFDVYALSKPIFYQSGFNEEATRFDLSKFPGVLPKTSAW